MKSVIVIVSALFLSACIGIPDGVKPVTDFDIQRYMGTWYEIARLDHSFERGLESVTAQYALRNDGGVTVLNSGYSAKDEEWSQAEGKAFFVGDETEGYLKVSFFGPFYGSYIIFELEQDNYEHAFVSGPDYSYLWLLSRKPNPPQALIDKFVKLSKELGFEVDELIFVKH